MHVFQEEVVLKQGYVKFTIDRTKENNHHAEMAKKMAHMSRTILSHEPYYPTDSCFTFSRCIRPQSVVLDELGVGRNRGGARCPGQRTQL